MRGVLTLAGEGSRMLPWTRGVRKEFLPLFDRGSNGAPILKPVANLAMETLVRAGVRDLVLVVGAADSAAVQNYFTIDREFLRRHARHPDRLTETAEFYRTLAKLRLRFAVQPGPLGFGDAVLRSAPFVRPDPFILHAGDAVLLERRRGYLPTLMGELQRRDQLDAVLLVRRVANPSSYGVVEGRAAGREKEFRRIQVTRMEEKPKKPQSNWAATAVYCFTPRLYDALEKVQHEDRPAELEVTAGIQRMLSEGAEVAALAIDRRWAEWRSVGSPPGFLRALRRTFDKASAEIREGHSPLAPGRSGPASGGPNLR